MSDDYERTVISIIDEFNEKSTITLNKWTSDVLHKHLNDVHVSIQKIYDEVCKQSKAKSLNLSRRERGNVVRNFANKKAMEFEPIEIDLSDFEF